MNNTMDKRNDVKEQYKGQRNDVKEQCNGQKKRRKRTMQWKKETT
jgi:hypothetical protein